MKSSKLQAPTSREIPSVKLQNQRAMALMVGAWNFSGAWMLVLGTFYPSLFPATT
jgi:hypothetical protein